MIKLTCFPLHTFLCVAFVLLLITSDKFYACLLRSDPFTCTLCDKLNLKLAPPILLSFSSSSSASQKLLYICLLFPGSLGFILTHRKSSFPVQAPFIRFYYLVDSHDIELQIPFKTCFHNTCTSHSTVQNQGILGTCVSLMTTEV